MSPIPAPSARVLTTSPVPAHPATAAHHFSLIVYVFLVLGLAIVGGGIITNVYRCFSDRKIEKKSTLRPFILPTMLSDNKPASFIPTWHPDSDVAQIRPAGDHLKDDITWQSMDKYSIPTSPIVEDTVLPPPPRIPLPVVPMAPLRRDCTPGRSIPRMISGSIAPATPELVKSQSLSAAACRPKFVIVTDITPRTPPAIHNTSAATRNYTRAPGRTLPAVDSQILNRGSGNTNAIDRRVRASSFAAPRVAPPRTPLPRGSLRVPISNRNLNTLKSNPKLFPVQGPIKALGRQSKIPSPEKATLSDSMSVIKSVGNIKTKASKGKENASRPAARSKKRVFH